ncbi:MAG: NAD(P)-dependent oxidoreductase [Candidatus Woesearchaeota archaeon]
MATIAFFELEPWQKRYIRKRLSKHNLVFIDDALKPENAAKAKGADILAVFIHSKIDKKVLNLLPKVKLVTTRSTGFDHIDLKECAKRKIAVSNVPAYGDITVAEHTFGLILAISRKIVDAVERTRKAHFEIEGLCGFDLKGKTLGVVGTGRIGRNVAHIGSCGFGMKVIAYDVYPNEELAKECGFKYVPFEKLLSESDVITFHVPLTKETTHMLNKKNLNKVKKGAILINTSRGAVIETGAILEGISRKIFSGVGLDVLEEECAIKEELEFLSKGFKKARDIQTLLAEHVLFEQPNVYVTPHCAFYSKEALERILDTTISNIESFLKKSPQNLVKPLNP